MSDILQIKADYKKYLKNALDNYDVENGSFPPEQDKDRLLTFEEFAVWWMAREIRLQQMMQDLERTRLYP